MRILLSKYMCKPLGISKSNIYTYIQDTGIHTVCPRSIDPFYLVTYCIKWVTTINKITILSMVTTSWTDGIIYMSKCYVCYVIFIKISDQTPK